MGQGSVRRLTTPLAFRLYGGQLEYHVPRRLRNAAQALDALGWVK